MNLCHLPLEAFRKILEEMVMNTGIIHAVRLRLVCKLFDQEIPSAMCTSTLFEDDPNTTKVPPESGLLQEYIFRLSINAKKNARELPAVINQIVRYLLERTSDRNTTPSVVEGYTRALCEAATSYQFTMNPRLPRGPPIGNNIATLIGNLNSGSIDIFAAAAILGVDDVFVNLSVKGLKDAGSSKYFGNPLVLAASNNHYMITKILLQENCLDGSKGNYDSCEVYQEILALKAAARIGRASIVKLILQEIHSHKLTEEVYQDALLEAVKGGHAHLAHWLVGQRNISMTACLQGKILETAAYHGHEGIVQEILENRADLVSKESISTALSHAAGKSYTKIAQLLIYHGAHPDLGGRNTSPLIRAAAGGHRDMAQILLKSGADINRGKWWRPLSAAASHGQDEMFLFLVEAGADVGYIRHASFHILSRAASKGYETMISILASHGADIKGAGKKAAGDAIREGHSYVVKTLVALGAEEPQPKDLVEQLYNTARFGYEKGLRNLISYGVDINSPYPATDIDCTPLWWTSRAGHSKLAKVLIELGAEPVKLNC